MKKLQGYAAGSFIFAVIVLGAISIAGIWKVFDNDVIIKSFETLGLLAVVSLVVIAAGQFMGSKPVDATIYVPNPGWTSLRKGTLGLLIAAVAILALLGVLTIWDVITDKDVLYKSLGTLAVLAFNSFIIVLTCKTMEGDLNAVRADGQKTASGAHLIAVAIVILFVIYMFVGIFGAFR